MRSTFIGNSYTLTPVAETGERFSDFAPYVGAIDNRGLVAFQAALARAARGSTLSDGERVTTVAESATGPFGGVCSHPDINPGGSCCFYASVEPESQAAFVVRDGEIAFLAGAAGPLGPTMNEAGAIAFRASTAGGGEGVFLCDGGVVTTIADTTGRFARFHGLPVVAGDGTVVFRADVEGGGEGVYLGDGATVTAIAETGGTFGGFGFFPFANEPGAVAFCASLQDGGAGVFTVEDGELTAAVDSSGPFESFRGALLDGAGPARVLRNPTRRRARALRRPGSRDRLPARRRLAALRLDRGRLRTQPRLDQRRRSARGARRAARRAPAHRSRRSGLTGRGPRTIPAMELPVSARELIESGALAHLVTLNPDGSPQVTCIWVGLDGDQLVSAHLFPQQKLRNVARNPKVVLSFEGTKIHPPGLKEYLVVHGTAEIEEGGAPELLQRLAHVYLGPDVRFPPMDDPPPGHRMRITVDRLGGVGPWAPR